MNFPTSLCIALASMILLASCGSSPTTSSSQGSTPAAASTTATTASTTTASGTTSTPTGVSGITAAAQQWLAQVLAMANSAVTQQILAAGAQDPNCANQESALETLLQNEESAASQNANSAVDPNQITAFQSQFQTDLTGLITCVAGRQLIP